LAGKDNNLLKYLITLVGGNFNMPTTIDDLIKGYKIFRQKYFGGKNQLFDQLNKHGQKPKILVIACSDSRVDPSILLNCKPGDLFVIRNVANLVPPCDEDKSSYHGTSAAIEFAVRKLGIKHIIILGHSQCGGIASLIDYSMYTEEQSFISKWMEIAEDARKKTITAHSNLSNDEQVHICAKYSIKNSINNLLTFPWLNDLVNYNDLQIHGWYFDIESGMIQSYNSIQDDFQELGSDIFFMKKMANDR
jgi:carbonic anhydrase